MLLFLPILTFKNRTTMFLTSFYQIKIVATTKTLWKVLNKDENLQ